MPGSREVPPYLAPLIAAAVTAVLSALLRPVDAATAVLAGTITVVIGVATYASTLTAVRQVQRQDRAALYSLLTTVLPSGKSGGRVLGLDELAAVEKAAAEIWVYGFDLRWEEEGPQPVWEVVRGNLARGTKYRYIVPSENRILRRVKRLQQKYRDIEGAQNLIEFRGRAPDGRLKLVRFGVTIYNPALGAEERSIDECLAVFFPHYEAYGPTGGEVFVSLRGAETRELQEEFLDLWAQSDTIPWTTA